MFSFFDVFLIVGVSQGLFISLALQLIHQKNKEANRVLTYLLLIACLMLLGRISLQKIEIEWVWRVSVLADTTIFLFGPFLYTYIRRLTTKSATPFRLHFIHFFPAIFHLCYFIWSLFISLPTYISLHIGGSLSALFFIIEFSGILSILFYWIKSVILIKDLRVYQKNHFSFELKFFQYIYFFLLILFLCILFWCTSFLNFYIFNVYHYVFNYNTMWILTPFFFYIVGFFTLTQPQLFRLEISPTKHKQDAKKRLSTEEIERIQNNLESIMKKDKLFINPELSLTILAERLYVSSNDLSWFLNEVYEVNFYNFINKHRVTEFVSRIDANEHKKQTILAIAMDVGFNSKSTFNKFFKSIFNQTPSEYIKTTQLAK